MPTLRPALLVLVAVLATACKPSLIAGTQVQDTEDNRAILDVVRRYKLAFEARDAAAIGALASPRYLDERSSTSKAVLDQKLRDEFARVKDARLDVTVRKIAVEGARATVDYFFALALLVDAPTAEWVRESDEKRMILEREGGEWRVVSGF
jgi:hypothetical protein